MNLSSLKRVYCVGLGGVGVSAVAKYLLAHGVQVSGSDPVRTPLIDDVIRFGGIWYDTADPGRMTKDLDLLIFTDDAHPDHPERRAAEHLGIVSQNFSVMLGMIMSSYQQRVCVAGTNGKSTTTALTGLLLEKAGLHPTVFVGSRVSQFDGNLRLGSGTVFVAEADEYRDHFLNLAPTVVVVSNIELDHVDYFHNIDRLQMSFQKFFDTLPADGRLIVNADDEMSVRTAAGRANILTFGMNRPADLRATDYRAVAGGQEFSIFFRGQNLGKFNLPLPGTFNVMNALAAMAAALSVGADPSSFPEVINNFHGVWRRFEILNSASKITIVSDYAHHPSAVSGTLAGAKAFYPGRRLVAIFQPHHHNRITHLFTGFTESFSVADVVMIVETYTVPGREPQTSDTKTGKDVVAALRAQGKDVIYAENPNIAQVQLEKVLRPGDVAIIMGAGDIWRIAQPVADHYA